MPRTGSITVGPMPQFSSVCRSFFQVVPVLVHFAVAARINLADWPIGFPSSELSSNMQNSFETSAARWEVCRSFVLTKPIKCRCVACLPRPGPVSGPRCATPVHPCRRESGSSVLPGETATKNFRRGSNVYRA